MAIAGLCFIGYLYLHDQNRNEKQSLLLVSVLSIFTCVMFLPSMHERYGYAVEVLTLVLLMINFKWFPIAFMVNILMVLEYLRTLFKQEINYFAGMGIINLVCYLLIIYYGFFKNYLNNDSKQKKLYN